MSRVVLKELIVLKGLYHTFESALSDHAENVGGVRLELGWLHYSDPYRPGRLGLINKTLITVTLLGQVLGQQLTEGGRQFVHPYGATNGNAKRVPHERRCVHHISPQIPDRSPPQVLRGQGN